MNGDTMAGHSGAGHGHAAHPGKTGSWVAVTLIVVAFVLGALGMILTSWIIGIIAGVVLIAGLVLAALSRIMEQVE